jgi:hypothetical protein
MIDKLSRKLNFNITQTSQDFAGPSSDSNKLMYDYLNEAYSREVNAAKIEVGLKPFLAKESLSWAASTQTLTIPDKLIDSQVYRLDDETDSVPGVTLWVGTDGGQNSNVAWSDRTTLIWGTTGPSSARTIMAYYAAEAEELKNPLDVPKLIPYGHRHLLIWSAAIIARTEADEQAPREWVSQLDECRAQYHTLLSRGTIVYPLGYTVNEPGRNSDQLR